jgi:hypothetical protein
LKAAWYIYPFAKKIRSFNMKHEWKKDEKHFYLPKTEPELIDIPAFNFYTIEGKGNPNESFFADYIGVLYSLSYAIKMSPKKRIEPQGYFDYSAYPLEGIWDLTEEAKKKFMGAINKDDLLFKLMIRQADFVDETYADFIIAQTKKNKPNVLLDTIRFEKISDGKCIQMMHLGSYENEVESFKIMEDFAEKENYLRATKSHREIYLSDARKTSPDKLKTVLRFKAEKK